MITSFPRRINATVLSLSDICYLWATCSHGLKLEHNKFRRRHFVYGFELAAKVGGLFEAQISGDLLKRFTGKKKLAGGSYALLIKPILGRAAHLPAKFPL